ncbi:MAG TPA: PQQ-binding-like beta-propeller repeat protein [Solirubrobacteraceae bacterium]|nr:PQQ-binding-like beta-propeller repeat protein [Solirubrobacteraceae bacterium]
MSEHRRRRLTRSRRAYAALGALLVALAAAALGAYLYERHRTGNVYHPHARFIPQPAPKLAKTAPDRFAWPVYGYDDAHTRFFPAPADVRPPFRTLWVHDGGSLLEFPPVIYGERIFQLADDAVLSALDERTGRVLWSRRLGQLSASSPAVTANTVYVTILSSGHHSDPGRAIALNSATGAVRWWRALPAPSESSPLLADGRLFFGSQSGLVYALDDRTGAVAWTYRAAGSVKASPTLSGGALYFGDYSGHLQAVSEQTGRRIWVSASEGALLGSGTFYSTAAVVYGRVYLGNTDGRVYAYDAATGRLDWAVQTGDYVYASPAVTNAPGLGPTVYLGSYNGTFYALNARSGKVDWRFDAHGRISGSATILGRIVYLADLGRHRIFGLGISTGRVLFEKATGAFDPAISDGTDVFLTGDTGLYGLAPEDLPAPHPTAPAHAHPAAPAHAHPAAPAHAHASAPAPRRSAARRGAAERPRE